MDVMQLRRMLMSLGGGQALKIEAGTYIPVSDVNASQTSISHSLGVVPDFITVIAEEIIADSSNSASYIVNAWCSKTNINATNVSKDSWMYELATWQARTTSWQNGENVDMSKFADSSSFKVPYYTSDHKLKSGVTYHYIIGKYE